MDKTIVYYTGNIEHSEFENRIIKALQEVSGETPIISVSQKPMDLGLNICVGEVGASDFNATRQLQIGAIEAKTKFVVWAESDCLYPPGYFDFTPERDDISYRCNNVWIVSKFSQNKAYYKNASECAQMMGRDYLIKKIDEYFEGYNYWNEQDHTVKKSIVPHKSWIHFNSEFPVVNFKTGKGMRRQTATSTRIVPVKELPYWGDVEKLKKKYGVYLKWIEQ